MDKSKRNLAKLLGVTGVGASAWGKPVVESVTLPAHAQATICSGCFLFDFGIGQDTVNLSMGAEPLTAIEVGVLRNSNGCNNPPGDGIVERTGVLATTAEEALGIFTPESPDGFEVFAQEECVYDLYVDRFPPN